MEEIKLSEYKVTDKRFGQLKSIQIRWIGSKDGINYEYDGRSFDIDTETMQLKASRDNFPPFISAEK